MAIKVQGEVYESPAALAATIAELREQAEQMPSEGNARADLENHIQRLELELAGHRAESWSDTMARVSGELLDESEDPLTVEPPSHKSAADADEDESGIYACPFCGQDMEAPFKPPQDPSAERCDACHGIGRVFTGSRVEGHFTRDCPKCLGQGFVTTVENAYVPAPRSANPTPELPGAIWNPESQDWNPPLGSQPPWPGAVWDRFYGRWA